MEIEKKRFGMQGDLGNSCCAKALAIVRGSTYVLDCAGYAQPNSTPFCSHGLSLPPCQPSLVSVLSSPVPACFFAGTQLNGLPSE